MTERDPGAAEPHPLRLLIVDDDVVDRMAIVRGLRSAGWAVECVEAGGAEEALDHVREGEFDCIFLDFHLPDRTGLDVLRTIRASGTRTPVVMLTGHGDEELAVQLMKAGASDYLPKGSGSAARLVQSLSSALRVLARNRGFAQPRRPERGRSRHAPVFTPR